MYDIGLNYQGRVIVMKKSVASLRCGFLSSQLRPIEEKLQKQIDKLLMSNMAGVDEVWLIFFSSGMRTSAFYVSLLCSASDKAYLEQQRKCKTYSLIFVWMQIV